MTQAFADGIISQYSIQSETINDISAFLATMFVPETPMMSMLPMEAVGTTTFSWLNNKPRPRSVALAASVAATSSNTTITLTDASSLMNGDVLEMTKTDGSAFERIECIGDPASDNTILVKRGVEGTTPVANDGAAYPNLTLIGNSRNGGEVDQTGIRMGRTPTTQYTQVFQFPVQVSGSANATMGLVLPPGVRDLFTDNQIEQMRNMKLDMEYSSYYGIGEAPSAGGRQKQKGVKTLCVSNKVIGPTNKAAYAPADFIRDTIQAIRDGGGDPDVAFMSTGFLSGLAKWGMNVERTVVGQTDFGVPIEAIQVPFLGKINFFESRLLGSPTNHTVYMTTSQELRMRAKRKPFWQPRGNRGDAQEGDYIAEAAIEQVNESHHAWVEGITGFAAP